MEGYLSAYYDAPGTFEKDQYVDQRMANVLEKTFKSEELKSSSIFAVTFNGLVQPDQVFAPLLQSNYDAEQNIMGKGFIILISTLAVVVLGGVLCFALKKQSNDRVRSRSNSSRARKSNQRRRQSRTNSDEISIFDFFQFGRQDSSSENSYSSDSY